MDENEHVGLQWVIVEGELRNISEFACLPPRRGLRPEAKCPVCLRPVIMKLGPIRSHHFAHHEDDKCLASSPETALHINAKYHLYRELQLTRTLIAQEQCCGGGNIFSGWSCNTTRDYALFSGWDDVRVEDCLGTRKPDLTLLASGKAIGAIEVFVTHSVDDEKVHDLRSLGISWVEVEGIKILPSDSAAWQAGQPLPIYRQYPDRKRWQCDECLHRAIEINRCQEAERKARKRKEEARERQEEYRKHNYSETFLIRIVDIFYPRGTKFRELFRVKRQIKNDKVAAIWLEKGGEKKNGVFIARASAPITEASKEALNCAFHNSLESYRQRSAIVDCPMKWHEWSPHLHPKMILSDYWLPARYRWEAGHWVLSPESASICWDGFWDNYDEYRAAQDVRSSRLSEKSNATWAEEAHARQVAERKEYLASLDLPEISIDAEIAPLNLRRWLQHYKHLRTLIEEEGDNQK